MCRVAKMGVFADDLKIYAKITSIEIALRFQYNFDSELGAKTMQMSLHRKPSPIVDDYTIKVCSYFVSSRSM